MSGVWWPLMPGHDGHYVLPPSLPPPLPCPGRAYRLSAQKRDHIVKKRDREWHVLFKNTEVHSTNGKHFSNCKLSHIITAQLGNWICHASNCIISNKFCWWWYCYGDSKIFDLKNLGSPQQYHHQQQILLMMILLRGPKIFQVKNFGILITISSSAKFVADDAVRSMTNSVP